MPSRASRLHTKWVIAVFLISAWAAGAQVMAATVTGQVIEKVSRQPVADATVMVQGTTYDAHTAKDGTFVLNTGAADLKTRLITAEKHGFVIGSANGSGGHVTIELESLPLDNPAYAFQSAQTCGGCHNDIFAQWKNTTMARAMNEKYPQKMSFYLGETTDGKFDGLGFGWKFFAPMMGISQGMHAMDLNHFVGTCANCHARGAMWKKGEYEKHYSYDPETGHVNVDGSIKVIRMDEIHNLSVADGSEGITCDVCHSVQDVRINHDSKGNLKTVDTEKMEVIRRGDVKFGPLKDAISPFHKTAYSPIFKKSEFCAMCHMERADDLEVTGVPSMITLDEYPVWKANFDAGKTEKQCQDCHMYTGGKGAWTMSKVANIGVERDPSNLFGHHWRGSYFDGEMAKRASNLSVAAQRVGDELVVTANVANVGAGHKMPGGPPFRQMLLLIDATDANGNVLKPLDPVRDDPADAQHANRIIDVGGGYRKYGFFMMWEMEHGKPFPEMPYLGHIGKVYNGSWVTPGFIPMEWMFKYLWVGVFPLMLGLLGWSPWNAMLGRPMKAENEPKKDGFFSGNVGTIDRLIRIVGGLIILSILPMPWALIGIIPLFSGVVGWCPTYRFIGKLDTREHSGFFTRNVGVIDRTLRILFGLMILMMIPSGWRMIGLIPLISGILAWCPTYRFIGNINTCSTRKSHLFDPNLGAADRLLRAAGGLFLLSLVFWGPKTPWGAIGIIPLFTAIVGWCIPYRLAGIDTRGDKDKHAHAFFWKPYWTNLNERQRRNRVLAGVMMLFVAVVMPKAFAMHMWPVGGFAAERVLYDTRINYKDSDTTVYRFQAPSSGAAKVSARLVYYRHWYFMEPIKGPEFWSTNKWKYLLHEVGVTVPQDAKGQISATAGNRDGSLANMPPVPASPGCPNDKSCVQAETGRARSQEAAMSTNPTVRAVAAQADTSIAGVSVAKQ
jgi:hypothetical protein